MDTRVYWIWLQQALGIGHPETTLVLERFAGAEQVYRLEGQALETSGFSPSAQERLKQKSLTAAKEILARTLGNGDWLMIPTDALYPPPLRNVYSPPPVLYGRGEVPDFGRRPGIAIVGTREADMTGIAVTGAIAAGLVAGGAIIVSGSARGVDAAALSAGLRHGNTLVSVLPCGTDQRYPEQTWDLRQEIVRQGGTLFSEYPLGIGVNGSHFRLRNRLLSGISMGVCVINAPKRSGALITAGWAREQGRDIYAVPGDVLSGQYDGVNQLIQEGAQLVSRPGEILREYRFRFGDTLSEKAADDAYAWERARQQKTQARWDEVELAVPAPPTAGNARPAKKPRSPEKKETPAAQSKPVPCPAEASAEAARIYAALSDTLCAVDELAAAAELEVGTALAALTELEILGCAESGAGQRYRLVTYN